MREIPSISSIEQVEKAIMHVENGLKEYRELPPDMSATAPRDRDLVTDFMEKLPREVRNQMTALGVDHDDFNRFKMKLRSITSDELYHSGKVRTPSKMFQVGQ